MKYYMLFLFLVLASCATVGPVTIEPDDTVVTVAAAFVLAVIVFVIKGWVEYQFAKRLERYKRKLDKE